MQVNSEQVKELSRRLANAEDRAEASAVEADGLRDRIGSLDTKLRQICEASDRFLEL